MWKAILEQLTNLLANWWIPVIGLQLCAIFILIYLLIRREKALQLLQLTITPVGVKLSFELNKSEKLKLLALEVRALQEVIKSLQVQLSKEKSSKNWILFGTFGLLITFIMYDKFSSIGKAFKHQGNEEENKLKKSNP